jgi:hypothetical protein
MERGENRDAVAPPPKSKTEGAINRVFTINYGRCSNLKRKNRELREHTLAHPFRAAREIFLLYIQPLIPAQEISLQYGSLREEKKNFCGEKRKEKKKTLQTLQT